MRAMLLRWVLGVAVVMVGWELGLAAADAPVAGPQKPKADPITFSYVKVVAFKDGNCLIIKHGVGTTDAGGLLYTDQVPDSAILGSFWAVPKDGKLLSMIAGIETVTEKETKPAVCVNHLELLLANKGRECTVVLADKGTYTGVIREVLVREQAAAATQSGPPAPVVFNPYVNYGYANGYGMQAAGTSWGPVAATGETARSVNTPVGDLFVLKTATGDVALPVAEVRSLAVAELALTTERVTTTTRSVKRLTFHFDRANQRQEFELMYFTPGFRWVPTYRLELAAEEAAERQARLSLQAELLNEIEDLEAVPIDLVVGVPNFRFKDTVSPLSLETVLRSVLTHTTQNDSANGLRGQMSNTYFANRGDFGQGHRGGGAGAEAGAGGGVADLDAAVSAGGAQDLFVYHLAKMSLKKGQRAAVPIFEATAPYRDLYSYRVSPALTLTDNRNSPNNGESPLKLEKNQVWHQVELENNTQVPWTTGPVMIMQGQQPIAQELLTYTARKAVVQVPVTVAVDIAGRYAENELGRQGGATKWQGYSYAKVSRQCGVTVTNRKKIAIELEVSAQLAGVAGKVSDKGTASNSGELGWLWQDDYRLAGVNTPLSVSWSLHLEPGQSVTPTAEYSFYVRE